MLNDKNVCNIRIKSQPFSACHRLLPEGKPAVERLQNRTVTVIDIIFKNYIAVDLDVGGQVQQQNRYPGGEKYGLGFFGRHHLVQLFEAPLVGIVQQ